MVALSKIFAVADFVLLDFDGPVCGLFSNYSSRSIAAEVRSLLSNEGIVLPLALRDTQGALSLLRWAAVNAPDKVTRIECLQQCGELMAVESAKPTEHADDMIRAVPASGRRCAIVSNNSEASIRRYLRLHHLDQFVAVVVGRVPGRPELMKPHPRPVQAAMRELKARPETCVIVGDATTDIVAAHRAGALSIGYANSEESAGALVSVGADVVVNTMKSLVLALGVGDLRNQSEIL